jgi:NADH-quinone oxidoreductase subunit H
MIVLAVMLALILSATAVCILAERKIAGFTQDRYGPNRVGFWGLLQPLADGLKFLLKEDIIPRHVDKPLFLLAPALALAASLLGFAIIPWAGQVRWPWMPPDAPPLSTQVANLNVGFLYLLAVGSLSVYGVVLAGYASNNKYAFYGGMRAAAQIISYELPLGLGLLVVLLVSGTLQLDQIVQQQAATGVWNIFLHPVAFFLVLVSALAEANRAPFDLPEAEQELVGGYHTEYSAMKFAMFFLGEYVHMITSSALMVALFFGGWHVWGLPGLENVTWWAMLVKLVAYLTKVALFIALFMLVRWTLPRFRFDQLMRVAWQSLVPIGVALLAATAVLTYLGWQHNVWASLAANLLLLVVLLRSAARSKRPVTARQDDLPEVDVRPTA